MVQRKGSVRTASAHVVSGPKPGAKVTVDFGRRPTQGTVVRKTVTGNYTVRLDVAGTEEPVTGTYTEDELRSA